MPILKKLKLKRKNIKSGCFNNPFLILIGILLIAVIIVILYHYFYKKSNTIERFYVDPDGSGEKLTASDENCQPDIRGKEWQKRNAYVEDLKNSGEFDVINECCDFNSKKEQNDKFKGYNIHCEAAFEMKLKNCREKGIGKDKDGNCIIESGSYKAKNTEELKEWRWYPTGYMASA